MMADIPALPPSKSIGSTASPPYGASDSTIVATEIQSLPDKFAQITRPVQLNGTIVTLNYNDTFVFSTSQGNLLLKLLTPEGGGRNPLAAQLTPLVQNQKTLSVAIQPGSPPTQAMLTLPPPQTQTASPLQSVANFQSALSQQSLAFKPGATITAIVLPPDVAKAFTSAQPQGMAQGLAKTTSAASSLLPETHTEMLSVATEAKTGISEGGFLTTPSKWEMLTGFLKSLPGTQAPADAGKPSPLSTAQTETQTAALAVPKETPTPQPALPSAAPALKTGTEGTLKIIDILPPNAPAPEAPNRIVATVIGKGPDGQLLLGAGENTLFVRQPGNLAVGSKLVLAVLPQKAEAGFALPPVTEYDAPAMQNVMAALAQIEPALAAQIAQTRVPQPNALLPSTMLFLFSALQQGNVKSWLGGDALDRLTRAGKHDLAAKLADELAQAGGAARDPAIGQWRAWPVPLYDGNQYQMLRLYVRRDRDRKLEGAGYPVSPQTRFLITMNMSRLGPMQMDGLSQKRQLDLIIRSERPLPPALPKELRSLYITTLDALGLAGTINFQTGKQNWVAVQKVSETSGIMT